MNGNVEGGEKKIKINTPRMMWNTVDKQKEKKKMHHTETANRSVQDK